MLCKRTLLLSIGSSALAFAAPGPLAAQSYPDKPIRIIVTVAAGGPMDTIARFVGQQMQARLGQPVVVENRPGAGSTLGGKAVASAEPDGSTLMWGTLSVTAIAPALYKDDGTFKSRDEIARLFADAGIDPAQPFTATCGSGVTANSLIFAAHLLGHDGNRLYDGSWSEWGADPATPKVLGPA